MGLFGEKGLQPAPTDYEAAKSRLVVFQEPLNEILEAAEALEVTDNASQKAAVELAGRAKGAHKKIEDLRKALVGPFNELVKQINALAKTMTTPLNQIERGLKGKIGQFEAKKELERRKAEDEARKRAAETQKKLDEEAEAAGVEPVKVEVPVVPPDEGPIRTEHGTASVKKKWTWEIVKKADIPSQYWMLDEKAINQAVRDGVREIPGLNIFQKPEVQIRR